MFYLIAPQIHQPMVINEPYVSFFFVSAKTNSPDLFQELMCGAHHGFDIKQYICILLPLFIRDFIGTKT
jgi:hypothetical protein